MDKKQLETHSSNFFVMHPLAKIGYEVTLVSLKKPEVELKWQERLCAVFFGTPIPLRILAEFLQPFDAVIVSNGVAFPFGFEAVRHTSRPLIVEWLHGEAKAGQCPAVDLTIAVSKAVFEEMCPSEHDLVIPNGVDLSKFQPEKKKTAERVTVVQIARVGKPMNPDLADLAPELINEGLPIQAHVVGKDGPSTENLTFHGVQSDVSPFLKEADILLHMSRSDSFGMTPIEAMACGVIPIVSNVGGLPSSVLDTHTGYVVPLGDTAKVKQILTELVWKIRSNHPDIPILREQSLKRAQTDFDVLELARRMGSYLELKAEGLPRKNRSLGYPFSFVATTLSFVLGQKDHFLAAIADVMNVADLTEALANWKLFLGSLGREWKTVAPETWQFLDTVYSRMFSDAADQPSNKKAVYAFWLAFLSLTLDRYDNLWSFLNDGKTQETTDAGPLSFSTIRMICFGLVIFDLKMGGVHVQPESLNASERIYRYFRLNEFVAIDSLKVDDGILQNLFAGANHPELLSSLRKLAGQNLF